MNAFMTIRAEKNAVTKPMIKSGISEAERMSRFFRRS